MGSNDIVCVLLHHMTSQVLGEYFNRATEATKMDFITMKGFDLLGSQVTNTIAQ